MSFETSHGSIDTIVDRLRRSGTDLHTIEVKAAVRELPKSVLSTISAFSNDGGGLVILGLDESQGFRPAADFDAIKIRDALVDVFRPRRRHDADGPITPRPLGTIEIVPFEDAALVVADIEEQPPADKPCYVTNQGIHNGSYERIGDGDHRMSGYQIYLLSSDHSQPQDDLEPVANATVADLDSESIDRYIARLRRSRPKSIQDLSSTTDILRRFRVLTRDGGITLAGLLCFGTFPQEYLPQLNISFASYPGTSKDTIRGSTRMLDRRIIDGSIPTMVEEAIDAVLSNLPARRVVVGVGALDEPEIPIEVLREAITNALAHRDYSPLARGDQVRIELYPDRLEIWNTGGIWGGRRVQDLFDGGSRSRNQALATLLTMVPLPGRDEVVSENMGSGIPRMVGILRKEGLTPRYEVRGTHLLLTLDRHGILDPETAQWLSAMGADELSADQRRVLALIHGGAGMDDRMVGQRLGIDSRDAADVLRDLTSGGWLQFPTSPSAPYRLGRRLRDTESAGERTIARAAPGGAPRTPLDQRILAVFDPGVELDIHQIVDATGSPLGSIRPRLRVLLDQDALVATAPPQSKHRRYLLPEIPLDD